MDGSGLIGGGGGKIRKFGTKGLMVGRFEVCVCDDAKLQGPHGNEGIVLCA